jgi:tetratricopeptide (TPR) repeat protein
VSRLKKVLLLGCLAALAYAGRELRLRLFAQHQRAQRYEDVYYLPPANWLPVISAGFRAAGADLIWCRSMVYFGEELMQKGGVKYAFDYTDAVLALDEDFRSAYMWIATAALYRPTAVSVSDGLRAAGYLKRALARWPNDGELHWRYGSVLRFELAPLLPLGPEKERLIALATPHLAAAASLGAGPPWLALNSVSLLKRLGRTEEAIRHLEEVYGTVQDQPTKQRIEEELGRLRSHSFVEALKTANTEFEQQRKASYPYLSPGMFLLVGQPAERLWPERVAHRFIASTKTSDEAFDELDEAAP